MRHQRKIRTIARLEEKRHASHKTKHGILIVGIRHADGDQKRTHDDRQAMKQKLLAPNTSAAIQTIRNNTAERSKHNIEQAEHSGPVPRAGLTEGREVELVVSTEDAVDSELSAERAEVATSEDEGLQGEDDGEGFLEGGLDDDFAAGRVEHVLFGELGLVVGQGTGVFAGGFEAEFFLRVVRGAGGAGGRVGGWFAVGEGARHVDHVARDAVVGEVLLRVQVPLGPFACRRVRAEEQHGDCGGGDEDEGHDEGDAPGDVGG